MVTIEEARQKLKNSGLKLSSRGDNSIVGGTSITFTVKMPFGDIVDLKNNFIISLFDGTWTALGGRLPVVTYFAVDYKLHNVVDSVIACYQGQSHLSEDNQYIWQDTITRLQTNYMITECLINGDIRFTDTQNTNLSHDELQMTRLDTTYEYPHTIRINDQLKIVYISPQPKESAPKLFDDDKSFIAWFNENH